jgi:glycerophosphoryl diester phosphodiesterase
VHCRRLLYISYMVRYILLLFLLMSSATFAQSIYLPKFDVQGHRGARGLKPENTIPGFITALDTGVTTLEMDVVITKDKQVVLSHEPWMSSDICLDPQGKEFSNRDEKKYNIYEMDYAEVKLFDAGLKPNRDFPQQEKMAVCKPLLQDVIVAVEDYIRSYTRYEVDYNIEIKSSEDGDGKEHPKVEEYSDLVYNLLDEYLPMNRIVIQSFDMRVLRYWHTKYPEVRLSLLVENLKSPEANLRELGFNPAVYSPHYKLINKEKITYLHRHKIRVIPWTVNDVKDMLQLRGMGADGFITDYPNRARKYKMTLTMNVPRK